jgi:hypothetical protein
MLNKLPHLCPSCASPLHVKSLSCVNCKTEVTGAFELPPLARLETADRDFITEFVKSSGSLKLMAEKMKLSYPTVRNMLDDIIERLNEIEKPA